MAHKTKLERKAHMNFASFMQINDFNFMFGYNLIIKMYFYNKLDTSQLLLTDISIINESKW